MNEREIVETYLGMEKDINIRDYESALTRADKIYEGFFIDYTNLLRMQSVLEKLKPRFVLNEGYCNIVNRIGLMIRNSKATLEKVAEMTKQLQNKFQQQNPQEEKI